MKNPSNRPNVDHAPESGDESRSQPVSDDGVPLTPVDGSAVLGDLEIRPIEPPPFSRRKERTDRERKMAERTATPDDTSRLVAVDRHKDAQPAETFRRKRDRTGATPRRAVFPLDDRKLYTPTNGIPNRAVCSLLVRYPTTPGMRVWGATGCLIGSRHVLTAGHVLFKAAEGGWATSIQVVPGMDGNTWWFGSESLVWPNFKQRSVKGWTEDQDIDYDYGLITLNTGFPSIKFSFGLLYVSNSSLDDTTAYILGYPGDLGSPRGTQQFGVPPGGGITDYDSTLLYYAIDTAAGQSGAGVYRFYKGERAIIAVHGGQYDSDENRGARITEERHDKIRKWQKEDE